MCAHSRGVAVAQMVAVSDGDLTSLPIKAKLTRGAPQLEHIMVWMRCMLLEGVLERRLLSKCTHTHIAVVRLCVYFMCVAYT